MPFTDEGAMRMETLAGEEANGRAGSGRAGASRASGRAGVSCPVLAAAQLAARRLAQARRGRRSRGLLGLCDERADGLGVERLDLQQLLGQRCHGVAGAAPTSWRAVS